MINEKELLIANDSYIKKDFYQIYPEILELVTKITERWDPQSSHESDPGIVLLKVLAFIADKNNYNIDKNILECFMPSASQEDSMRKLCDMMGYEMRYFQSALTRVSFMYVGNDLPAGASFTLPAFTTVVSNEEDDVEYVMLDPITISAKNQKVSGRAIEGTLCTASAGDSELIKIYNLDDNNRFYLPETSIAENGIFIVNAPETSQGDVSTNYWDRVDNLNTQLPNSYVYKFGFDSKKQLPYVQFPEDIANLIGSGLSIKYMRTTGANGNVSAKTLVKRVDGTPINIDGGDVINLEDEDGKPLLLISNESATTNGMDRETINEAYNSFKRTVGTFDTLVTCRDYANKIYQLVSSSVDNTPLVSNVQVSDIRDDLNRSNTVMTYSEFGVEFKSIPAQDELGNNRIDFNDLIIYSLTPISGAYTRESFLKSFKPNISALPEIESYDGIAKYKTLSHHMKSPKQNEVYCIKNYYNLSATITTTYKVNKVEEESILKNVYTALYKNFNARMVDFGEELLYDDILNTIKQADTRIKNVDLDDPEIESWVMLGSGRELKLSSSDAESRNYYMSLLSKNILAGKVSLLDTLNNFKFEYNQKSIPAYSDILFPTPEEIASDEKHIVSLDTSLTLDVKAARELHPNEVIQFVSPNFRSYLTYPAYVNYYFVYANGSTPTPAVAAKFNELTPTMIRSNVPGASDWPVEQNTVYLLLKNHFAAITAVYPVYYITTRTSKTGGYLIDANGNKYKEIVELTFDAGSFYTPNTSAANYLGKDAIISGLPAGRDYKLHDGDILYINYTDSNDQVVNIKYTYNEIITNGQHKAAPDVGVIIRPNFELLDSSINPATKSKKTGFDESWNLDGMYGLGPNQQIEMRDIVETVLGKYTNESGEEVFGPVKCYWWIKDGRIPFVNNEYILGENEYFAYTNDAMTELVLLGPGTLLKNHGINFNLYRITNEVDLDDVASDGLAAFEPISWETINTSENNYLEIIEQQVITLVEKDVLNSISLEDASEYLTSDGWVKVDSATYTISGSDQVTIVSDPEDINLSWRARTRLDLNVGPTLTQTLYNDEFHTQTITAHYKDGSTLDIEAAGNINPSIRTNYLLQQAGGTDIDVHITEAFSEESIDDFSIMIFQKESSSATKSDGTSIDDFDSKLDTYDSRYTRVSLADYTELNINANIPEDSFGLIMLHYTKAAQASITNLPAIATDSGEDDLSWYNDTTPASDEQELREGINVFKVSSSGKLTISRGDDTSGNIIISDLVIVKTSDNSNGVAKERLGLLSDAEATSVLSLIHNATKDENNHSIFYYNNTIDNSTAIDVDKMNSEYAWYDYNNVCNKFVISELNAENDFNGGIKLKKNSRL